jgi:hypothetical protein
MYDGLSNDYDIPITASTSSSDHDYDIPQGSGKKKNISKSNIQLSHQTNLFVLINNSTSASSRFYI